MMLVHTSLPSAIDMKQENTCVWVPGDKLWREPDEQPQVDQSNIVQVIEHKNKDDSLCSLNFLTSSHLSEISTPNFVYKRRKLPPKTCSTTPNFVYKRRKTQSDNSKSGSVDCGLFGEENPKIKMQKCLNLRAVNDSCSSSKSNLDLGSGFLKSQTNDVSECSSSGEVVITNGPNSCISFLRKHGVLERRVSRKPNLVDDEKICCLKECRVCDRSTLTLEMIVCDLCEDWFHISCCNPVMKKVPIGDWFCNSCSRKKIKKINPRKKDCLGPILSMLRDGGCYASNVRIGEDFQVQVPDWAGPLTHEISDYIEPMEMSPLECGSYQGWKLSGLGTIGNWLQCREILDGIICGKWRRAPLFEVQSDNWQCFSCVLWDPAHADCAVPQEVDTDEVVKQLKYIEMLRPRLCAKKLKLGVNKGGDGQEHSGDQRNTQKS